MESVYAKMSISCMLGVYANPCISYGERLRQNPFVSIPLQSGVFSADPGHSTKK